MLSVDMRANLLQGTDHTCRARLPALYSDFRAQRTLNPDGYRANVSAWRQALSRLASSGLLSSHGNSSPFVMTIDQGLLRSLEHRQYGQPLALGTAVREAISNKDFVPLQIFLNAPQDVYQRSWSELPWEVVGWTLRQLGVIDPARGEDKLPQGRYAVTVNLENAAKRLSDKAASMSSNFDRTFTKAQFQATFAPGLVDGQKLSDTDVDVFLRYLSRDKQVVAYDGHTVKIFGSGEKGGITEEDGATASIKELIATLTHQTQLLNARLDELTQTAKDAVTRKNRVAALGALKSKKITESSLSKRYASLNQLEEVAARIEQATDNAQLVRVMASSTDMLRNLNAQIGSADRADAVMDRLREQMSETDEVAAILAESNAAAVDEGELDDELEAMERSEKEKEQEAKQKEEEKKRREEDAKEAAAVQKKLDELPQVPADAELGSGKEQTPTTETGIANLSMQDEEEPEKQKEEPLRTS